MQRRRIALVAALSLAGCHASLEDRQPVDTGTFGNTVLTLVCKRLAYLDSIAAYNAGQTSTVDVRGDQYRDVCRLGLAPPANSPDDLKALEARRDPLTPAVDAIFPDGFLPNLQTFLTSNDFLAAYDDGTADKALDGLIGTLRLFAADDQATAALERFGTRLGYRPLEPGLGAVRAAVNYPGLHDLLLSLTNAVTPGGSAKGEWDHLISAAAYAMRDAQVAADPTDSQRSSQLAVDLLLTESQYLGSANTSIPLVRRDRRGLAQVATINNALAAPFVDLDNDKLADTDAQGRFVDQGGQPLAVPSPFTGAPDAPPVTWANFDASGRPTDASGNLIYEYVDVDKTVLAALARDGVKLFDPSKGTALNLLRGASALMGPRADAMRAYDNGEQLAYRGYDLSQSALLDMTYGYMQILRDPNVFDTLLLAKELIDNHEAEASRIAEAVIEVARKGDAHPEAQIDPNAPMWDDLIPIFQKIAANPNLTRALLKAMENPKVANLGKHFEKFMQYKDQFTYDSNQAVVGAFATLVDRSMVDSKFNRSLFQRILLLINDSSQAHICNKQDAKVIALGITAATYNKCEMFHIDGQPGGASAPDLAIFFLQSIAYSKDANGNYICEDDKGVFDSTQTSPTPEGCYTKTGGAGNWRPQPKANFNYNWNKGILSPGLVGTFGGDGYLEDTVGIQGMRTHPTPEALGRVLFVDHWTNPDYLANLTDPTLDRWGSPYLSKHAGSLPVWEKDNFYDDLRPVVQAFADNNQEQLFVDLMVALNKHWATKNSTDTQHANPNGADYVWGSGAVTYEPLIIDQLDDESLMKALVQSAPALDAIKIGQAPNQKDYIGIVQRAAAYVLTPQAGLKNRLGQTTSTTSDGRAVGTLSPWQILADAYVLKQARIAASGDEGKAWTDSMSQLVDVLARGDNVPTLGWKWRNPRFKGVADSLVWFVVVRNFVHAVNGDRDQWLAQDLPKELEDTLANPLFAGFADFIISLEATPETRQQIEGFLVYLNNEVDFGPAFTTNVTALGDLLQLGLDDNDLAPIVHVVGEAIDPSKHPWLEAHLEFVKAARASDTNQALVQIARNLYTEHRPGHTAIGDVIDGISEVLRANPYQDLDAHYTQADYKSLLNGVANFLDENKRGLRKFIRIIQTRNVD
ncbi:MAG TPA: hypothetical protein VL463_02410 [Kofleriaceae bacterium]|nr:hypothetical protein [Kofleriaceae bacterium]